MCLLYIPKILKYQDVARVPSQKFARVWESPDVYKALAGTSEC